MRGWLRHTSLSIGYILIYTKLHRIHIILGILALPADATMVVSIVYRISFIHDEWWNIVCAMRCGWLCVRVRRDDYDGCVRTGEGVREGGLCVAIVSTVCLYEWESFPSALYAMIRVAVGMSEERNPNASDKSTVDEMPCVRTRFPYAQRAERMNGQTHLYGSNGMPARLTGCAFKLTRTFMLCVSSAIGVRYLLDGFKRMIVY